MAEDFLQFAFSAGVLSPAFYGRADLEKYNLGLQKGKNWVIDFRGGAFTRPGFDLIDFVPPSATKFRLWFFQFNRQLGNTYALLFVPGSIYFIQNGAYVMWDRDLDRRTVTNISAEANATITTETPISGNYQVGDPVQFTFDGDWPEAKSLTFFISELVGPNSFRVHTPDGEPWNTLERPTGLTNITVQPAFAIRGPFTESVLDELYFDQFRDELYITCTRLPPYKLIRRGQTSWELQAVAFEANQNSVFGLTLTPQETGSSGAMYVVTSVNSEGQEGPPGGVRLIGNSNNMTTTVGQIALAWPAVVDTSFYNIYRSVFYNEATPLDLGQEVGFLGRSYGRQFTDSNINPDFSRQPLTANNPFSPGRILRVNITNAGAGYAREGNTVSIAGAGSGFQGYAIVDTAGAVLAVNVIRGGSGYVNGSAVTVTGDGSGFVGTIEAVPSSGTFPRCSTILQQRRIYAGTENLPMTFWGSRPGLYDDFSLTTFGAFDDAFEKSLPSPQLTPVLSLVESPVGLFAFTDQTVYQIRGANDSVISDQTLIAEPRTFIGAAPVQPLSISDNVVYVQSNGLSVQALRPNQNSVSYGVFDTSLYSDHFFSVENPIEHWGYAESDKQVIWAQRRDGTLLSFTYIPQQNVYAWSNHETRGYVRDLTVVREGPYDYVYAIVERTRLGRKINCIERLGARQINSVEDLGAVDSAISTVLSTREAELAHNGIDQVTFSAEVLTEADLGSHLRFGSGLALIEEVLSASSCRVSYIIEPTEKMPESGLPRRFASGTWTIAKPALEFFGLWHLEGETVQVFADGNVEPEQVVEGGKITLQQPASRVIVGLPWTADFETLPLTAEESIIQDKKARVISAALRVYNSRGLEVSAGREAPFYAFKDRTNESYDEPTRVQTGIQEIALTSGWDETAYVAVRKTQPLHSTIQNIIVTIEVGTEG